MAVLKRIVGIVALVLCLGATARAETIVLQDFGYLNNNESSAIIDKTQAQDLLNVDVTAGGHSIKKRSGYGLYKTLTGSAAIHGGYHFFDSSGNDVQIWGSSTSLWGIVSDATPTQLVSSATLASTWDCTDIAAFAYCVDSSRDALIKTNGATISWYSLPSSNVGTMIIATPERLIVAGSAANPNVLYFSGANNYTNFTTGVNVADPFPETIAAPGSRITHLKYAFGRILWWKDQSFGYILGTDQTNLQIVTLSNSIGTLDNTDAFFNNVVYFRAQDGQIYQFDGASLTLLSRNISPTMATTNRKKSNSWTLSSQADFDAGSYSNTTSTISVGDVVLSAAGALNLPNSGFESNVGCAFTAVNWSFTTDWNAYDNTCNWGGWTAQAGTHYMVQATNVGGAGGSYALIAKIVRVSDSLIISSQSITYATGVGWTLAPALIPSPAYYGSYVQLQFGNSQNASLLSSDAFILSSSITYYYRSDFIASSYKSWGIDTTLMGRSSITSGVYYSPVHNAPSLATWDTFNATKIDAGGSHSFFVRSSTSSFTTLSSTPAWVAQTLGAVVAASTGTYFQMSDTFTLTGSSTPVLNDFTFNWFEGAASDKMYATYFQDAIWFAVSNGASATTNNRILRYDLLNKGWGIYDIAANGFVLQNTSLYFGDPNATGKIFKFGGSTSDAGTAITAYWKSKDLVGPDPFLENELQTINVATKTQPNETLSVTYTTNTSTSTVFSIPLTNSSDSLIRYKKLIAPGKMGGFFNLKFSDTSTGSQWEVFGVKIDFRPLVYRPS